MMGQKPSRFGSVYSAIPPLPQMFDKLQNGFSFACKSSPRFPANGVTVRIDYQQTGFWTHLHTWTKRRHTTITTGGKLRQQFRSQMIPGWHDNRQKNRAKLIFQWLPAHLQISQYRGLPPMQTQFPGALTRSALSMVDVGVAVLRNSHMRNTGQGRYQ